MPWNRLHYLPGINKEATRYGLEGAGWYDGNLVRFRAGYAEMWGGWIKGYLSLTFLGICRSLHRFSDLSGFQWLGVGTNSRFYVASDDLSYDVTPIGDSAILGANPFTTVNASMIIQVTHMDHGHVVGDDVIFSGSSAVNGVPATEINMVHTITGYVSPDVYQITVTVAATSSAAGGGAAVTADYIFEAGSEDQIYGGGWGSDTWGEDPWGGDPTSSSGDTLGIWTQDNWGEDLVANAAKGPIFYWDATNPSNRMLNIRDLIGADGNAPSYSEFILVSHKDRHLLAFGATEFSSGNVASMSFRWCNQEDILNWNEADLAGTAGSLPLSRGSRFVAAVSTSSEIVAWTDQAMYSITYLGAPLIYGANMITDFSDIIGMKAAGVFDSNVLWMGRSGFYSYSGSITKMQCTVWDYVSNRIDYTQSTKIFCSSNRMHDEVIWFYPSTDGDGEIDSYVCFDVVQQVWTIGALNRTAWLDLDTLNNPIAASTDGSLYIHEYGADDGSTNPVTALPAYIESSPIEISRGYGSVTGDGQISGSKQVIYKGDVYMFIRRVLPDLTFRGYSDNVNTPKVNMEFKMFDKPGGGFETGTSGQVSRSAILPVEEFTEEIQVRLRGRAMILRIGDSTIGTRWRLGVPRIDLRSDGQRG